LEKAMSKGRSTETVSVQTTKDVLDEIDALAAVQDRSRGDIVSDALRQYLDANSWQIERIREGIRAAQEGHVRPAEDAFADIAAKHGWNR
jgi:predicted transcriptional regulator